VSNLVSRDFEIDRVKNEIQKLDADIRSLLGPVAEKQAMVNRLEREVKTAQDNLKERRESLLALTKDIEAGIEPITFDGAQLTLAQAKARLDRDFRACKRADGHLKSRQKLLGAQQKTLQVARDQLGTVAQLKDQFVVHLAELEAREADLQLEQAATPSGINQAQIDDIRRTLDRIQHAQDVAGIQIGLEKQYAPRPGSAPVDLTEVRSFLGVRPAQPKVVSGN
jgi:chromosome segregation ATPase